MRLKGSHTSRGRGVRYAGSPGTPIAHGIGPLAVTEDEPGVFCLSCGTRIKFNQHGHMKAHAPRGFGTSAKSGHYRCEGLTQ